MKCGVCGCAIPAERAAFLKSTSRPQACIKCSEESPKLALLEYGHKTAPSLVVIGSDHEAQRLAWAAYRRKR